MASRCTASSKSGPRTYAFALSVALVIGGTSSCKDLPLDSRPCAYSQERQLFECVGGYQCCLETMTCQRTCPAPPPIGKLDEERFPAAGMEIQQLVVNQQTGQVPTSMAFLRVADQEQLWITTLCGGLTSIVRRPFSARVFDSFSLPLPDPSLITIRLDSKGTRWMVSRRGYLYAFDGELWKIIGDRGDDGSLRPLVQTIYPGRQPISSGNNLLAFDAADALWFPAREGRLARLFNGELVLPALLPPGAISAITVASDGVVWAASEDRLYRLEGADFAPVQAPGGTITSLATAGAPPVLLVTTQRGAFKVTPPFPPRAVPVFDGAQPAPAAAPRWLRVLPTGELAAAFDVPVLDIEGKLIVRKGFARGTLERLDLVRPLDVFDVADGASGTDLDVPVVWWLDRSNGPLHTNPGGGFFILGKNEIDDRLPWRNKPLLELLSTPPQQMLVTALSQPHEQLKQRNKLLFRGTVAGRDNSPVLLDENEVRVLVHPASMHPEWIAFQQGQERKENELGQDLPPDRWNAPGELQDYYGYLEPSCAPNTTFPWQFVMTENYPASMPEDKRAELRAAFAVFTSGTGTPTVDAGAP